MLNWLDKAYAIIHSDAKLHIFRENRSHVFFTVFRPVSTKDVYKPMELSTNYMSSKRTSVKIGTALKLRVKQGIGLTGFVKFRSIDLAA